MFKICFIMRINSLCSDEGIINEFDEPNEFIILKPGS